jgi:hypothetical protein
MHLRTKCGLDLHNWIWHPVYRSCILARMELKKNENVLNWVRDSWPKFKCPTWPTVNMHDICAHYTNLTRAMAEVDDAENIFGLTKLRKRIGREIDFMSRHSVEVNSDIGNSDAMIGLRNNLSGAFLQDKLKFSSNYAVRMGAAPKFVHNSSLMQQKNREVIVMELLIYFIQT